MKRVKLYLLLLTCTITCGSYFKVNGCSRSCKCLADTIDCSSRGLTQVPPDFPVSNSTAIRIIKLNDNKLTYIPDEIGRFPNLEELYLQHNDIADVKPDQLMKLIKLTVLDLSSNNIVFSEELDSRVFEDLAQLKVLKIKQKVPPDPTYSYPLLRPLNGTLEQLFLVGTPDLTLNNFTKLKTLSLGGKHCNISGFLQNNSFTQLPLERLSARNCHLTQIDASFLKSYQHTLKKLDFSCNPLKDSFEEILIGVSTSPVHTVLLDHINYGGMPCVWNNITNDMVQHLKSVPLKILSLQANHFGLNSNLSLRTAVHNLTYLDVSQNDFGGIAFKMFNHYIWNKNEVILFQFENYQLPSLRFLGLNRLTLPLECGDYDPRLLDCYEDSYLFLEDDFYWDHVDDPDIMDVTSLPDITNYIAINDICSKEKYRSLCNGGKEGLTKVIELVVEELNLFVGSPRSIEKTFKKIPANSMAELLLYLLDSRYLLVNLTTLSLRYNTFSTEELQIFDKDQPCLNFTNFPNNLRVLDMSYSLLSYIPCYVFNGYQYLRRLLIPFAQITGWNSELLAGFPVERIDLTGNKLAPKLTSHASQLFSVAKSLKELYVGEQGGGKVSYITDPDFLSCHSNLSIADLHSNGLSVWNVSISGNRKLKLLNLSYNAIGFIEPRFQEEFDNMAKLNGGFKADLTANPVDCKCGSADLLSYIDWLTTSKTVTHQGDLMCQDQVTKAAEFQEKICKKHGEDLPAWPTIVIAFTSAVVIIVLLYILYRTHGRIASLYRGRNSAYQIIRTPPPIYSSYASSFKETIDEIQESWKQAGLEVYCRDTGVPLGVTHKAGISELITQAEKAVIFLTSDYFDDELSKFEWECIQHRGQQFIVLITLESDPPPLHQLPDVLAAMLRNNKHINWTKDPCKGQDEALNDLMKRLTGAALETSV